MTDTVTVTACTGTIAKYQSKFAYSEFVTVQRDSVSSPPPSVISFLWVVVIISV